jgi:hypothetical protein
MQRGEIVLVYVVDILSGEAMETTVYLVLSSVVG